MNPEEHFLRQAVRGLSPSYRRSTQQELRSHLYERRTQLMAQGFTETEALRRAVVELGEPAEIRRGFHSVAAVHPLLSAVVLAALGVLAVSPLWILGPGNLYTTYMQGHGVEPSNETRAALLEQGYIPLADLNRQVGRAGVQLTQAEVGQGYVLQASGTGSMPVQVRATHCPAPVLASDARFSPGHWPPDGAALASPIDTLTCAAQAGWPLRVTPAAVTLDGQTPVWPLPENSLVRQPLLLGLYEPALRRAMQSTPALRDAPLLPAMWEVGHYTPARYTLEASGAAPVLMLVKLQLQASDQGRPGLVTQFVYPSAAGEVEVLQRLPGGEGEAPIRAADTWQEWLAAPADEPVAVFLPLSEQVQGEITLQPLRAVPR